MVTFTARLKEGMYKQLKVYADEEGVSLMAALRQILRDFFRRRSITGLPPQ